MDNYGQKEAYAVPQSEIVIVTISSSILETSPGTGGNDPIGGDDL